MAWVVGGGWWEVEQGGYTITCSLQLLQEDEFDALTTIFPMADTSTNWKMNNSKV